ncbi:TetR family transcriptional regulator [Actinoplanes sp. SE50]|uniref:TetR/AcrR family transcriptional regulator n=1 Tax=unclassified Actinoplanes TaxID=2626549 RepID=UPI00023EBB94|nr:MULTISPECIES: TetR/AcrR family transcriptional regulator [unclassified Actinoplanes]AEV84501.1 Tetracycline repressor protein class H [Actinoplanes sp. SE50/110]ATO82893.1 TetR family transcriptional regulator [Actinoplanes sp. SE50]SLM00301.1 TetR family transcriptional regulator [Actinoplanes sp. SE50/110]
MVGQQEPVIWLRPERAAAGRPAERSRAEITAVAVRLADHEGLEAVSMRRVAALLGTGAASLYRYVATRDDLLDLMIDSTAGEYRLSAASGDWQADLLAVAHQARDIMRRHPWLPALVIARPALGPHGIDLLEHVLAVLDGHPAEPARKLRAFALLGGLTALFVQNEVAAADVARQSAYLRHAAAAGDHPYIAAALAAPVGSPPPEPFIAVLTGALTSVLGPDTAHA